MTTPTQSDLQKATDQVNPNKLADNLDINNNEKQQPQDLNDNQTTPFIDEDLRTDK